MKKQYALILSGIMAAPTFTSCNRAAYSVSTATAMHQAQTVASAPAPTEATTETPAQTASASTVPVSPASGTTPARQAANALVTNAVATKVAAEAPVPHSARQSVERQPQAPSKPTKISKGIWIGIGVGVVLAILRIVASS